MKKFKIIIKTSFFIFIIILSESQLLRAQSITAIGKGILNFYQVTKYLTTINDAFEFAKSGAISTKEKRTLQQSHNVGSDGIGLAFSLIGPGSTDGVEKKIGSFGELQNSVAQASNRSYCNGRWYECARNDLEKVAEAQQHEFARRNTNDTTSTPSNTIQFNAPNLEEVQFRSSSLLTSGATSIGTSGPNFGSSTIREPTPQGLRQGTTKLSSTGWTVTTGSRSQHFRKSSTYGPIRSPSGSNIVSLNNVDVARTSMQRDFFVGANTRTVTLGALANFVTTEFPDFVGTEFNDTATITVRTSGGQVANVSARFLFNASVNGSRFRSVTGLPVPLNIDNDNAAGGQTGFRTINVPVNVAPGSRVRITVTVRNVGDTAFPSAVLLSGTNGR